jgi:flagellar biosynthesis GTPase FlhF
MLLTSMKIKISTIHRPGHARRQDLRQAVGRSLGYATVLAMLLAAPVRADDMADVSKLLRSGKVVEALGKTNEYLTKHPADPQMRFMKGVLLTEQNKNEEAIAVFTKLTEDYRDLPEPYNNLAVLYAAGGQYEKARIALEKAIRTNPSYMTAYENLGDVYGKMASQAYDKALALGSSSTPAKSKLTLLRTFSSSTGVKVTVPEQAVPPAPAPAVAGAAARPPASAPVQLISPIPVDAGKSLPPQRIPALSVSPPAAVVKPAPVVAAVPAKPDPAIAKAEAAKLEAAKAEAARLAKVEAAKADAARIEQAKVEAAKQAKADAVKAELAKVEAAKQAKADAAKALLAKQEADKLAQADAAKARLAKLEAAKQAKADAAKVQLAKAEADKQAKAEAAKLAKAESAKSAKADNGDRDAVLGQVRGWAKAWAAQNVDSYLGYYSSEFEPPKGLSRKAWSDERRARIEGKGRIHVEITAPEVVVSGNTAKVTFRQTYESDRLTARSHKTLMLVKNGGKWQIKQESSGS